MNVDRKAIKEVANKTLRTSKDGKKEISYIYLTHLRHFLTKHPDEANFTINLDDGVGAVYCCVCDLTVSPGKGSPEENGVDIYGSLANYEEHLTSQSHQQRKRLVSVAPDGQHPIRSPALKTSQTEVSPPRNNGAQQPPTTSRLASDGTILNRKSPIDLTRTAKSPGRPQLNGKGSVHMRQLHTAASNNDAGSSRVTTARPAPAPRSDIDADFELALQLHRELNGLGNETSTATHRDTYNPSPKQQRRSGMSADSSTSPPARNKDDAEVIDVDEIYDGPLNYKDVYQAQLTALTNVNPDEKLEYYFLLPTGPEEFTLRCNLCIYSTILPGSGRVEYHFEEIAKRMEEFEEHLKSPYHCRKRQEATASLGHKPTSIPDLLNPLPYREGSVLSISSSPYQSPASPNVQPDTNTGKREWEDDNELSPDASGFVSASALYNGDNSNDREYSQPGIGMDYQQQIPPQPQSFLHQARNVITNAARNGIEQPNGMIRSLDETRIAELKGYGSHTGPSSRDFGLNYDDSGPVSKSDVGSVDPESRFRDFMNKALDDFKDVMSVTDAQAKLQLASQDDLLGGMAVRLLPHQIIGVSWMVDQERDREKNGGILADAMGLGKTVQMIATMAVNRPPKANPEFGFFRRAPVKPDSAKGKSPETDRRTTLVLAPASLLQQWSEEFHDKAAPGTFRVHVHHGKDKLKSVKELEEYDVIITSYQTLTMDIPKIRKVDNGNGKGKDDSDIGTMSSDSDTIASQRRSVGPLAKVKWLRVVIDEAQNIRNRSTRISKCVAKLDSRYRWCLTGTPVTNSLADLYGYMRFCRFEPWNDWKWFNERIAKAQKRRPAIAGERAQTALRPHLLRRTKESKIDGRNIIQLGPKDVNMVELDFSPEEREMYTRVETNQKQIVSRFYRDGTVMKNYAFILIMILRLRQLCCHPTLATTKVDDKEEENETSEMQTARIRKIIGEQKFEEIIKRFRARVEMRMKAEVNGTEADDDECAVCMEPITNNRRVTACGHEFCADCLDEVIRANEGGDVDEEGALCPLCRAPIDRKRIFFGKIFEPSQDEIEEITRSLLASDGQPRPLKRQKLEEKMKDLTLEGTPEPTKDKFEPSTKMRHMVDTLIQWCMEAPQDKVIVYSQWTSMLDLVEQHLKDCGLESLRYDGKMNRMARADAVTNFKKTDGPPIMLISLKCGGVGLNLTCANRVVNLDLAWNYATEAQAYDRVHRLGQHKPVTIQRLIIKDTIEERIIRLQAKKQGLSDAALGEGTAGKIKRMTAREIAQLFDLRV